jgi:hypothetical protein
VLAGGACSGSVAGARGESRARHGDPHPRPARQAAEADGPSSRADGEAQCYPHIPFARAQELVKHWSAAGIPILVMQNDPPSLASWLRSSIRKAPPALGAGQSRYE